MSVYFLTLIIIYLLEKILFPQVMPRAQNAHAYVNAGFLIELDQGQVQTARICFGGITAEFVHATATEEFLIGKELFTK